MEEEAQRPLPDRPTKDDAPSSDDVQEEKPSGSHPGSAPKEAELFVKDVKLSEWAIASQAKHTYPDQRRPAQNVNAPTNELPTLRDDSLYARITDSALRTHGKKTEYVVPQGFTGFVTNADGSDAQLMLPGEKADGAFHLHLFKSGTLLLTQETRDLTSSDGYDLKALTRYSLRLNTSNPKALRHFIENVAKSSAHQSEPLIKSLFTKALRDGLREFSRQHKVEELTQSDMRKAAEENLLKALKQQVVESGLTILGIDSLRFESADYQKSLRRHAERTREAEEDARKREVETLIMREEAGAALSRAELSEVLDSIQHKNTLKAIEHEVERKEREAALNHLEQEYAKERYNLESTLKKMSTQNQIEVDRIKFDEYLRMTNEVRERLQEDRLEFYVHMLKDEKLKADLIRRLIEKDMTPEQLRELAVLEKARSERMKPVASEETQEEAESLPQTEIASDKAPTTSAELDQKSKPLPGADDENTQDAADEVEVVDDPTPVIDAITETPRSTFKPLPEGELQTMLVAAGRYIYAAEMHPSGKATQLSLFLDLNNQELGSIRSLTLASINNKPTLFAGARCGVYSIDVESKRVLSYPIASDVDPETGVNAVLPYQGKIYATHSRFGLLRWSIAAPAFKAERFLTEHTDVASRVRGLFLDDSYWPTFVCDSRLLAIEHDTTPRLAAVYTGAPSSIVAAFSSQGNFYAACEDGSVVFWDKKEPANCQRRARTRDRISAATLSSDGKHIVLATRTPNVRVFNLESGVLARYDAPQPIRLAREFGNHILGIARNRSTLYVWESFGNGQPITELPLPDMSFDVIGMGEGNAS